MSKKKRKNKEEKKEENIKLKFIYLLVPLQRLPGDACLGGNNIYGADECQGDTLVLHIRADTKTSLVLENR